MDKISPRLIRAAVWRCSGYLALWIALIGVGRADLPVGIAAAAGATWLSIRLLPPGDGRLNLAGLPRLVARFAWQALVAGVEVARCAFSPALPLNPGFVVHPTRLPRGPARNAFASISSLLPGTVAVRDDERGLLYHCLDTRKGVLSSLAADEAEMLCVLPRSKRP